MFVIEKNRIFTYLKLSLFQTFLFVSVYGFTNWFAGQHQYHFQLWLAPELNIPFIPGMILGYISLNLLMIVPMFTLDIQQLNALNRAMFWFTIIAGIFFLTFPAPIGFVRIPVQGIWSSFYQTLYSLDQTANTFPSLHITFSYLFIRIIIFSLKTLHFIFWSWFILIACSVLFTHQHHLLDIIGGILLAESCFQYFFLRALNDQIL